MKRVFLFCVLLGMMSSICGDYVISRTITINESQLAAMRSSTFPGSPSHDPLIDSLSESNSLLIHDDATYMTRTVPDSVSYMNSAVNDNLYEALFSDTYDEIRIRSILLSYLPHVPIADTVAAFAYFRHPGEDALGRALDLTYYTINAAMLYDCLYYVPTNFVVSQPTLITDTLNNMKDILLASIHLTMETIASYDTMLVVEHREWGTNIPSWYPYPGFSIVQYRLQMFGAMGLAALLLRETTPALADEMNAHLDYINNVLLTQPIPDTFPADRQHQGMLAFHTTVSGAYFESMDYLGQVLQMISPFFTAYKRLSGGSMNYYNNQYIVSWINDLTRKVTPNKSDWSYNDDWAGSDGEPTINPGSVFFYYNNTGNQDVRSKCAWYVKCKPAPTYASYGQACRSDILVKYLSDPVVEGISSVDYIPSFISQGSSSSREYSILRNPIDGDLTATLLEFDNAASLYVVHENSFAPYHNQSDHLSYSFYYKGKPFLIDPGYRVGVIPYISPFHEWSYSRQWMRSIYAHNMVIVDPDYVRELHELRNRYWDYTAESDNMGIVGKYRPWSPFDKYNDLLVNAEEIIRDPCFRDYYQQSENLDLLRTRVVYDDVAANLPTEPIAEIRRSFARYGGLFLILDDVDALDNELHEYSSLYQFGVFNQMASVDTTTSGFTIQKGNDAAVDVICGSTGVYVNQLDNPATGFDQSIFPTSKSFTSSPDSPSYSSLYGHSRGRTKVIEAEDTSILAIIAPQDASNPVTVQNTAYDPYAYYGVEVLQNTRSIPVQPVSRFLGCTNGLQQSIAFGVKDIDTNGKLFAVSVLPDVQPYVLDQAVLILEGDNMGYDGIDLYRKYSGNDIGCTATYSGSSLDIVFHGTTLSYPRFKVYRSGADPEQFTGIFRTQIDPQIPEPIPYPDDPNYRYSSTNIVQSLAYDDQYFYVNYGWDDLVAAGLVDDNLVLVKATIPEIILNTDLNIQGDVSICGSITISHGASMDIYPNSSLTISENAGINNHGTLSINGETSRSTNISNADQLWSGITTYSEGILTCSNAVIEGARTGIHIRGYSTISNCEIVNCYTGIAIETVTTFTIEGNSIYQNTYGLVISNSQATINSGVVAYNEVSQNIGGVLLYNSNTNLSGNNILHNARSGIHLIRESDPIIKLCNISSTEANGLSRPEITLESDSYPVIDDAKNDINTDGLGYSLYYTSTWRIKQLLARNNYWGSTNAHHIRDSMYPPLWDVVFDPFCLEPNTYIPYMEDNLFKQALQAEESGDLGLAKQLYASVVVTEPDSLYALQSLGRLNSLYAGSPNLLSVLRNIYSEYALSCSDSILVASAQVRSVMLDRFDMQYLQAIQAYEDLLGASTTELDSLLCLLDIAYTLQDMYYDDQGKGTHTGASYHANGMHVSTLKEANLTVDRLWDEVLSRFNNSSTLNVPVPTRMDVTNYPNPFNPTTTIAFSLPEEGIVRLSVYNIRGQQVNELINENLTRGFHRVVWDGRDSRSRPVSSGLYFYRLSAGGEIQTRKMLMMK